MTLVYDHIKKWLHLLIENERIVQILSGLSTAIIVLLLSVLFYYIVRQVLWSVLPKYVAKTKSSWDDVLMDNKFFRRLSHLAPAIFIYAVGDFCNGELSTFILIVENITKIYIVVIILQVLSSFSDSVNDIYNQYPSAKERPIKGYLQLIMIIFYVLGGIFIFSVTLTQNPMKVLTGMGAMAAVIMLVFKDTILGFVASIQLAVNRMVKIGDWIELPSHQANGTVEDISLTSVKVQNWDKTITTLPTYELVSNGVKNWKGMEESGGRRIKRSLNIDLNTIHFCDENLVNKLQEISLLSKYLKKKKTEIEKIDDNEVYPDGRTKGLGMTNIGIFRIYLENYLKKHPLISNDMTFLVRQLQPSERGLPIEIYVFSIKKDWSDYEAIQADLFDHILSIIPIFELSLFQNPSGDDFKKMK